MMKRRDFLQKNAIATLLLPFAGWSCAVSEKGTWAIQVAGVSQYPDISYPSDKRVPLNWKVFPVSKAGDQNPILRFASNASFRKRYFHYLRLTTAIDFREIKRIKAFLPETGVELGEFVMWYAHPFQPFEIPIDRKYLSAIDQEGIGLRITEGTSDAWFFLNDSESNVNHGLQPHILSSDSEHGTEEAFYKNLYSMNSFSPFGWMGGSVQDALFEMHLEGDLQATQTLKMHLEKYLDAENGIRFENPHTRPLDGTFNSIEDFLPFVSIASTYPDHIAHQNALEFIKKRTGDSVILYGNHITTEGCYTLAYPMAAWAGLYQDEALAQQAVDQLLHRMRYLTDEGAIYQRSSLDGHKTYRNWGRGVVWYLLGIVKTLRLLENESRFNVQNADQLQESFRFFASKMRDFQDNNGCWASYVDQPELGVDTSTTAGIAAAMAWGVERKWLDVSYLTYCEKAYQGLIPYLSPDGFLRNVSQINRGGEDLQMSPYRVITQFGMGLMGQLAVAIEKVKQL
ncbi:MAG: glycoside hydrolase family 88 protein [Cyclobacteriaceae bacterium]|nr:glycoside hydrolase family 88 protein [Cyclobacteriaceae bacterium]